MRTLQLHTIRTTAGYAATTVHVAADVQRVNGESRRQAEVELVRLGRTPDPRRSLTALWAEVDDVRGAESGMAAGKGRP